MLSVFGRNTQTGESSVWIHMPINLPGDLLRIAPHLRYTARIVAGNLEMNAESHSGVEPHDTC